MLDRAIGIIFEIVFFIVGLIIIISNRNSLEFAQIAAGFMAIITGRFMNKIYKLINQNESRGKIEN